MCFSLRHNRRRGVTLLELMIASGLLMIVLGGVAQLIQASSRHYLVLDASLELQKESVLAASMVTREMAESNSNSVEYFDPSQYQVGGVVFGSPRTTLGAMQYTSNGTLVWQKKVTYFIDQAKGRNILARVEAPLTPIKTAFPPPIHPTNDEPAQVIARTPIPKRIVARDVDSITLDTSQSPVQITLELSSAKYGKPFTATIQSKIHFRN